MHIIFIIVKLMIYAYDAHAILIFYVQAIHVVHYI